MSPQFATTGHLLFVRNAALWAVPFDPDRLEVDGTPRPIVEDVHPNSVGWARYSVADDGTLLYRRGDGLITSTLVWVDREGRGEPLASLPGTVEQPRVSPDGRSVAVTSYGENTDVWILDDAGRSSRLTTHPAYDQNPVWTPSGERIVFESRREDPWTLGTGPVEKLLAWDGPGGPPALGVLGRRNASVAWLPNGGY